MKKTNLNILITGASRGIGKAITQRLAPRCANLFITSKNKNSCDAVYNMTKDVATNVYINNFNHEEPEKAAKDIGSWIKSKEITELDAIVLDAGIFIEGELSTISIEDFNKNLNVNFLVNHYIVSELLNLLKNAKSPRIIIIGSTASYRSYCVPSYGVAKFALRGYAINLRKELSLHNIGVTFISPGGTLTDMWEGEDIEPNRLLCPEDIASIVDTVFTLSNQAVIDEIIIKPMLGDVDE